MKGSLGIAGGLLLALAAMPAGAATLYRCVGEDGVASYVNRKVPGAQCRVFQHYVPERRASRPKVASAPASQAAKAMPASATGAAPVMVPAPARSDAIVPAPLPAATAPVAGAAPRRRVQGQVYAYMKDGVPHYTSRPPAGGAGSVRTIAYSYMETCYACAVNPGVSFAAVRLNTSAYQAEIAAAAREFGVEEAIVRAIIHAESAFNPAALSHAGAQGLMQLMPATAQRFGVADSFDAAQNIRGGVQYLAWLLKRFNGDLTLAAAGYNAGEGAVDRYRGVPPYSETQRYVQRVAVLAERYRGVLAAR
ncbi:lytic transglycosylase domain-containing protein [Pseudoxanthomonas sp. J35]|uniref:lytic transglycosylase domain-containing protein n=1 Tax=Pseudoxanthomonas sp. J35 TaxID=935852 RepID=UPI00048ED2A3|nr:lytic transglycosylase domain-containing protein [Pseudoxanthomonas sp. J35]